MSRVREIAAEFGDNRRELLSMLHRIQDESPVRCLEESQVCELAGILGMPVSELYATASFYTMFSFRPRGRYVIRVCESPPCHVMGAGTVFDALRALLGVEIGGTTADGLFTLEACSCLGICGVAPALMINDDSHGNLTPDKLERIIREIRDQEGK